MIILRLPSGAATREEIDKITEYNILKVKRCFEKSSLTKRGIDLIDFKDRVRKISRRYYSCR